MHCPLSIRADAAGGHGPVQLDARPPASTAGYSMWLRGSLVGTEHLNKLAKSLAERAGLQGIYSGHSLTLLAPRLRRPAASA